jgi:hypothetical protein
VWPVRTFCGPGIAILVAPDPARRDQPNHLPPGPRAVFQVEALTGRGVLTEPAGAQSGSDNRTCSRPERSLLRVKEASRWG